jgi:hypothetical protein
MGASCCASGASLVVVDLGTHRSIVVVLRFLARRTRMQSFVFSSGSKV